MSEEESRTTVAEVESSIPELIEAKRQQEDKIDRLEYEKLKLEDAVDDLIGKLRRGAEAELGFLGRISSLQGEVKALTERIEKLLVKERVYDDAELNAKVALETSRLKRNGRRNKAVVHTADFQ
jgi:hypothetical protein